MITKKPGSNFVLVFFFGIFLLTILFFIEDANAEIKFKEVTEEAGVYYFGDTYGSYWGNFNEDEFADLWTPNHGKYGSPRLYVNNGDGTFLNSTFKIPNAFLKLDKHGSAWLDFDNDGDQDLFLLAGGARGVGEGNPNFLLKNNEGIFENIAKEYGIEYHVGRGRMPLPLDWNGDGKLDIVIGNAARPDGDAPSALFIQKNGFYEIVHEFKTADIMSLQSYDLFADGTRVLIISTPNLFIFETGSDSFENLSYKIPIPRKQHIDFVIADFNNDLINDVFLSTGGYTGGNPFKKDILLLSNENNWEIQTNPELLRETSCLGVSAADFDNDMDLDIYLVCGIWGINNSEHPNDQNLENILYENLNNGSFASIKNAGGSNGTMQGVAETVSLVDFDNDGFIDIFVTNGGGFVGIKQGGPNQLFKNLGNKNNWLEIDLIGKKSNKDGIGSRVLLTAGGITQLREQAGGFHYRAQNHDIIHFGLGNNTNIDQILIFWPSGIIQAMKNVEINQSLKIFEPTKSISPLKQIKFGIDHLKINCNDGLVLIPKFNGKFSACVKKESFERLMERSWSKIN